MVADRGCEKDVVQRANEGYRAWGALKSVKSTRGFGLKSKKCLFGVSVPMALCGGEAWGMKSTKGGKCEMKCLRSWCG